MIVEVKGLDNAMTKTVIKTDGCGVFLFVFMSRMTQNNFLLVMEYPMGLYRGAQL